MIPMFLPIGRQECADRTSGAVNCSRMSTLRTELRLIRRIVNEVLAALDGEFTRLYGDGGRPSIAPERLLRALLLQVFYTIRSERQLMEQLSYNLLYRWFVGLGVDEPVWVPTVFTKNRERLLQAEVAHKFLAELLNH